MLVTDAFHIFKDHVVCQEGMGGMVYQEGMGEMVYQAQLDCQG